MLLIAFTQALWLSGQILGIIVLFGAGWIFLLDKLTDFPYEGTGFKVTWSIVLLLYLWIVISLILTFL